MNIFQIAWKNLRYRGLASLLTTLSMALGVTLCILVLTISSVISSSMSRNSSLGYNIIVGTKGGATQLVLNTVFYLSQPNQPFKYDYYLEFLSAEQRNKLFTSITGETAPNQPRGRYADFVGESGWVIPVCLGDYVGEHRLVATTPEYFEKLRYGDEANKPYTFAAGRNFQDVSPENGFFEAVIGAQVADNMDLKIGDKINASHGPGGLVHADEFEIVGILDRTGTPNDRAAFINIEGFYLLEGHVAPERNEVGLETSGTAVAGETTSGRLPMNQREITALLVHVEQSIFAGYLMRAVNKTDFAQAVSPIHEVEQLLTLFVTPLQSVLLLMTLMVCLVSAVSILVSIYNSMNERTRDIAIMRALGASRDKIVAIIFGESLLITLIGAVLGIMAGKLIALALSPIVEQYTGIVIPLFQVSYPTEPLVVGFLILIGTLAGLIPAMMAYRTNVARNL